MTVFLRLLLIDQNGFIAGGDYDVLGQNRKTGTTTKLIVRRMVASCVQYVPGGEKVCKQLSLSHPGQ
jgi:hypothetical protein